MIILFIKVILKIIWNMEKGLVGIPLDKYIQEIGLMEEDMGKVIYYNLMDHNFKVIGSKDKEKVKDIYKMITWELLDTG